MLREGPIPAGLHGLIEYLAGVLFIAAPFIFAFEEPLAIGISVAVGVIVLVVAAATAGPTGIVSQIPVPVHVVLDYVVVLVLIASPFLFGFSDEPAPRNFFLIVGVVHLLISIGTRFRPPKAAEGGTTGGNPAAGGSGTAPRR